MKTKFALLIVVTALSLPFSQTQALAEAPTGLSITSGSVVAGVLSFDSEVPNCASLTPQYKYFSSDDAVNVLTRMAMVNEKDKRSINILVIMATAEMIPNCTIDSLKTEHFSVTLPPGIKYRSIFDMVSRKYVTGGINNPASPSTPDPSSSTTTSGAEFPRNVVDFLAVRQVTATGTVYNDFAVVEVHIGIDGLMKVTDIAKRPGSVFQIKAVARDGVVLTEYNFKSSPKTYMVRANGWTQLSTKTIFVEPAAVSINLKTLYGRQVKDAMNSTKIFKQDLKTGATPTYFDAAKHGGGFICGVVPDPTFNFAYFSHLMKKSTDIYRINLSNGGMKKVGTNRPGVCLDGVDPNGDLFAKYVDPASLKPSSTIFLRVLQSNFNKATEVQIASSIMFTGQHSFLSFGNTAISKENGGTSMQLIDVDKESDYSYHYQPIFSSEGLLMDWFQYFSPLPATWITNSARPTLEMMK